jgi:hypothetical protein
MDIQNINLPDHKTNEPASHGYVRFRIAQKAGNPIGTNIENQASIILDYNSPIITNLVTHQIGELPVSQSEKVQVDICINNYPTIAQSGTDQVIYEQSSVALSANHPQNGRGQWKLINGKGILKIL